MPIHAFAVPLFLTLKAFETTSFNGHFEHTLYALRPKYIIYDKSYSVF